MTRKIFLSIALMFIVMISEAQKNVYLTIKHMLGNANFAFNQTAQNDLTQDFQVTRVDYYISSIYIIHDGGQQTQVQNKYILAKGSANVVELLGNFNVTNVEGVKFSIGVDSPVNNDDPALWPSAHPLAPQSPSMHWGWSAGYRFIALEGQAGASFNTTFQMHGLGNANYFSQTQMAAGVSSGNDIYINLDADYSKALKGINVNAGPIDHGVNATDLDVINNFRDYVFSPGTGIPASVKNMSKMEGIRIYPNPSFGEVYVDMTQYTGQIDKIIVLDMTGKMLYEQSVNRGVERFPLVSGGLNNVLFYHEGKLMGAKHLMKY